MRLGAAYLTDVGEGPMSVWARGLFARPPGKVPSFTVTEADGDSLTSGLGPATAIFH